METFRTLTSQTSFTVYAEIPRRKLSAARMQEFCAVVSSQSMASLAARSNATRLYQIQGGYVIEGDTLAIHASPPVPDEAPRKYSEPTPASQSLLCEYSEHLTTYCAKFAQTYKYIYIWRYIDKGQK